MCMLLTKLIKDNTEEELKSWSVIRILHKFQFLEDNIQTCSTAYHGNNYLCLYTIKYILIFTDRNLSEDSQYRQNQLQFLPTIIKT